jgi:hypothetical protein
MIGRQVPFILIPRYTSYIGQGVYLSAPVDVSAYADAIVTVWRGKLVGGGTIKFVYQLSTDAASWADWLPGPPDPAFDPGENTALTVGFACTQKWARMKVTLTEDGEPQAVTCWASGLLTERVP